MLLRPCCMEDTLFFISEGCSKELIIRLPNFFVFPRITGEATFINKMRRFSAALSIYYFSKCCRTVYLSGDLVFTNKFLHYCQSIIYLEDGVASYHIPPIDNTWSLKKSICRQLLGPIYPIWGWADRVQKIYLTGLFTIPEGIVNKVELFNLKQLWTQRHPEEQKEICRVLLPEGIESIRPFFNRDVLLLTQPYSEDSWSGIFQEEDKIEVYRKLLFGINESTVLIKVHPRETTDYKKYFPCAKILCTTCPMELIEFLGVKVKKAITINSTAIYNMDPSVEKIVAGGAVTPCLAEEMLRRNKTE